MRRVASNEAINLQVSNGLEILLSIVNKLTVIIRSESADEIAEVLKGITEAAFCFLFTRGFFGAQKSGKRPHTPAFFPTKPAPVPLALSQLSTPAGESGDPSLGLRPGRGAASSFVVCACHLTASSGSFQPVAMGVLFILLSPGIRVLADDGGTVADPCD